MKKTIIIDSNNLFIRNYVVNPVLDSNGNPMGGCKGYMQSLQKMIREMQPDKILLVWDGPGGSRKRRSLFAEYKEGRRPLQHNKVITVQMNENEQQENRQKQAIRLFEYLNLMPFPQFMFEDFEADDIIASLSTSSKLKDYMKIIVSSDTDFYQLCSDEHKTYLFRPIQKTLLTEKDILVKMGVSAQNFALAKSIVGDKADNIEGISGAGYKTAAKHLPCLTKSTVCTTKMLFEDLKTVTGKKPRIITEIEKNREKIEFNYRLIQLYEPRLPMHVTRKINDILENFNPVFQKNQIIKMMASDGFGDYNWSVLFGKCLKLFYQ